MTIYAIIESIFTAVILTFSIVTHEISHGYTALLLGDNTAKYQKRLSFNPIHHANPKMLAVLVAALLLTKLLPILSDFAGIIICASFLMLAKPVPINPSYFKDPKKGMAITALMGPVVNIVFAFIGVLLFVALYEYNYSFSQYVMLFLQITISINVSLAVFNLIPFPPLDGSKILFAFLPSKYYFIVMQYERYIMLGFIILVTSGRFDRLIGAGSDNLISFFVKAAEFILRKG